MYRAAQAAPIATTARIRAIPRERIAAFANERDACTFVAIKREAGESVVVLVAESGSFPFEVYTTVSSP